MAKEKDEAQSMPIKDFLNLSENNFTEREKFAYELSFKAESDKTIVDWKKLINNGN